MRPNSQRSWTLSCKHEHFILPKGEVPDTVTDVCTPFFEFSITGMQRMAPAPCKLLPSNLLVSLMVWIYGFLAESIIDLVCSLYQSITDNKLNFCCRCFKWWMARRLRVFRMVYVPPKQHLPPRVLYK